MTLAPVARPRESRSYRPVGSSQATLPASLVGEMKTANRNLSGLGLGTYPLSCGTFIGHGGLVSGTQSLAVVSDDGSEGLVVALNHVSGVDPALDAGADRLLCRAWEES